MVCRRTPIEESDSMRHALKALQEAAGVWRNAYMSPEEKKARARILALAVELVNAYFVG